MPKETHLPINYHTQQSPRPRHHYPMHHGTSRPPQQQQPPPSSAAAKAAAAAKALHRRALDRAQQKQSAPSHPPRNDPRYDHRHDDYPPSKTEDRRKSTMAVFRRSSPETTEENRGLRMEGYLGRHGPPPASHAAPPQGSPQGPPQQPPQNRSRRREDEYNYSEQPKESDNAPPPNFPAQPMYPYGMPGYPYPYGMPPPGAPPNYPEEEEMAAPGAPPMIHRPREEYHYGYYDPNYFDPNYAAHAAAVQGYPPYYPYPYPPQPPGEKKEEKRVSYTEQDRERNEQHPSMRSTRRIIGSHTPIHVPRADSPYAKPLNGAPNNSAGGRSSVFRSADITQKERNAHEILLSLSKSFDKRDGERPKSPEEPPQLKHFHKEKGEGFEPQPSPLRPTNETENDIEFAPSFTLFNQSFDMNLENLLGPNASFGLGPMKSLSFGLGLGSSIDYSDNPRASPISIHRAGSRVDKKGDGENVQVLRASPSNDFGNVLRAASSGSSKKGTMLLGDSVRVSSPSVHKKKRSRSHSPKESIVLDGNARDLPFRLKDDAAAGKGKENGKLDILEPPSKKKKTKSSRVHPALFKILENHQSLFAAFSFLLPGAKSVLTNPKSTHPDVEIARRRINSALCAFGGSALPKQHSWSTRKTASRENYESLLPERYYEDDNRLSWEVEEDPPVEISDEESDKSSVSKSKSLACDSTDGSLSLQRNMGVMVYPAINAFVAAEPGLIAPALSEMNNFVSGKKSPECTPAKATMLPPVSNPKLPMVSPDCVKGPELSGEEDKSSVNYAGGAWISNHQSQGQNSTKEETVPDHLFIDKQDLVPEQYRVITNNRDSQSYDYPTLPVPYAQRKRMSNAVFAMSKSIPGLTEECAIVLSDARKKDAWDFAVAELMTQVVVLTHCQEGDWRLDGLSKYLLSLGIAC